MLPFIFVLFGFESEQSKASISDLLSIILKIDIAAPLAAEKHSKNGAARVKLWPPTTIHRCV